MTKYIVEKVEHRRIEHVEVIYQHVLTDDEIASIKADDSWVSDDDLASGRRIEFYWDDWSDSEIVEGSEFANLGELIDITTDFIEESDDN